MTTAFFNKTIITCAAALLLAFTAQASDKLSLKSVDPLTKVLSTETDFPNADLIEVARGENAVLQIIVTSTGPVSNLSPSIKGTEDLGKPSLGWLGEVKSSYRYTPAAPDALESESGNYPDPIIYDTLVNLTSGKSAILWIDIAVPGNAEAGTRECEVKITGLSNGRKVSSVKTFKLHVYDVTLPDQSLLVTNWYFPEKFTYMNHGQAVPDDSPVYWKCYEALVRTASEFGQNVWLLNESGTPVLSKDGKIGFDFSRMDKSIDFLLSHVNVKLLEANHIAKRSDNKWTDPFWVSVPVFDDNGKLGNVRVPFTDERAKDYINAYFPALEAHLQSKKLADGRTWLDIYTQHIADEPINQNLESWEGIARLVKAAAPKIKIIEAYRSDTYDQSLIDILVPQLDELAWDTYRDIPKGLRCWFYTCMYPRGNFANRYVTLPLIKTRLLHWINYKYDSPGYLHWGFNFWGEGGDPYGDVSVPANEWPGGDSHIVYPGYLKVYPSIRLSAMRDGIRDYELLKMVAAVNTDKAKEFAGRLILDFDRYDTSVATLRQTRREMLELLESHSESGIIGEPSIIPKPVSAEYSSDHLTGKNAEKAVKETIKKSLLKDLGKEGYRLSVSKKGIRTEAATEAGLFYAKQTLKQLRDTEGYRCAEIKDYPRFSYRGIHVDVSRHFFAKEEIMKILDEMAYYKMNNFHLHLTDNGGWRIQIDKYPKLTELGAYRVMKDWDGWWKMPQRLFCTNDTPGAYGGFYTKDDIREIVRYAEDRHINVIPEIEFPAHSDAVFVGYPELSCEKEQYGSGEFCMSNPRVYQFAYDVLDEVMELFPSKVIHIGGDEARHKFKCSDCLALMKKEGMQSYDELQRYMIAKLQKYLNDHGRDMGGWDEIVNNEDLSEGTVSYTYRGQKNGIRSANRGVKTVFTPGEILYFDWYTAMPSKEPKAMWGYSPLKKMHSFDPLPVSKERAAANEMLVDNRFVDKDSVKFISPENAEYVIGVQGCAWSEYISSDEHLEYMMFPRLLAISELGWTEEGQSEWSDFKERVNEQIPGLRARGIRAYDLHDAPRITTIAPNTKESIVTIESERTDVEIRYTLDGSEPLSTSSSYQGPFSVKNAATIKAAAFKNGNKVSYTKEFKVTLGQDQPDYYKNTDNE